MSKYDYQEVVDRVDGLQLSLNIEKEWQLKRLKV